MDDHTPPPIPKALFSAFHDGRFVTCDACNCDLATETDVYQVQKTWKNGEVVFEIALCLSCLMEAMSCLSKESMESLRLFHLEHYRPVEDLESCHFCRKEFGPDGEYEVSGVCAGLFLARPPAAMCGECAATVQERLSRPTREGWSDFIDKNVPGVPESMVPDGIPVGF